MTTVLCLVNLVQNHGWVLCKHGSEKTKSGGDRAAMCP